MKESSNLIGDDFDILLDKDIKPMNKPGYRFKPHHKDVIASITWNGAIRLLPNRDWLYLTFEQVIGLVNHEITHIVIGQTEGVDVSIKYDKLDNTPIKVSAVSPYSSDLYKRSTSPEPEFNMKKWKEG